METIAEIFESCLRKDIFFVLTVNRKPWMSFKQEMLYMCVRKISLAAVRMTN